MRFSKLIKGLDQLVRLDLLHDVIPPTYSEYYDVRNRWFAADNQIPNADRNGVYFYLSYKEDVLYIGKGIYSQGGGIGYRSCAHLGKAQKTSGIMFPYHEWASDEKTNSEIKNIISTGKFFIASIVVEPDFFIPLFEVYLQTGYMVASSNNLPPLNKRIG